MGSPWEALASAPWGMKGPCRQRPALGVLPGPAHVAAPRPTPLPRGPPCPLPGRSPSPSATRAGGPAGRGAGARSPGRRGTAGGARLWGSAGAGAGCRPDSPAPPCPRCPLWARGGGGEKQLLPPRARQSGECSGGALKRGAQLDPQGSPRTPSKAIERDFWQPGLAAAPPPQSAPVYLRQENDQQWAWRPPVAARSSRGGPAASSRELLVSRSVEGLLLSCSLTLLVAMQVDNLLQADRHGIVPVDAAEGKGKAHWSHPGR